MKTNMLDTSFVEEMYILDRLVLPICNNILICITRICLTENGLDYYNNALQVSMTKVANTLAITVWL